MARTAQLCRSVLSTIRITEPGSFPKMSFACDRGDSATCGDAKVATSHPSKASCAYAPMIGGPRAVCRCRKFLLCAHSTATIARGATSKVPSRLLMLSALQHTWHGSVAQNGDPRHQHMMDARMGFEFGLKKPCMWLVRSAVKMHTAPECCHILAQNKVQVQGPS